MKNLNAAYWDEKYKSQQTGWDIGYASPPITEYFDQIEDKNRKILIPGAGNAWEAEYLWKKGFHHTFVLDFSEQAAEAFKIRVPDFPSSQIIVQDFFQHKNTYDIIVEQTFFTSFYPQQRPSYVQQMHKLLKPNGKLMGVLFNHEFSFEGPPFGGTVKEYQELFEKYFHFNVYETAYNSIKPRQNSEHFILLHRKG